MIDWGLLADQQIQEFLSKKLSSYSHQTGLKLEEVTQDYRKSFPPPPTLKDYMPKAENKGGKDFTPKAENKGDKDFMPKAEDDSDEEDEEDLSAAELSLLKKILRTRLLQTTEDVEVQRRNNNSPLYSVKSFEQLHIPPNLLKGIHSMGFNSPSRIQETALPTLLANPPVNMIAQSQSGTGKTAAFLVASLARIDVSLGYPQVLILAPTFELALQIGKVAEKMAKYCPNMSCRLAVQKETLDRGAKLTENMVIGTPGKVFDWGRKYRCFDLSKIEVFVLDEADVMIDIQGHQDNCIRIHQMLDKKKCQMLLFSATYTQEVMDFAEQIVPDPIVIRVRKEEETLDNVHQYYVRCNSPDVKYTAFLNIYGNNSAGQTICFCRTKRTASWLGQKLAEDGHSVGYLSSDLNVQERYDVIQSFRSGREKILITTNVCARGIDVEQVTMVFNFDMPVTVQGKADCETYLHRIGRTGRFGKDGIAVSLVSTDKDEQLLHAIEQHFGKPIRKINIENLDDLESMSQC